MKKLLLMVLVSSCTFCGYSQLYLPGGTSSGINNNSPSTHLEYSASSMWNGTIRANGSGYTSFALYENSALRWALYNHTGIGNTFLIANAAGQDKFSLTQTGNFGIDTYNPQVKLDVANAQGNGLQFRYDQSTNYRIRLSPYWNTSTDTRLDFNIERAAAAGFTTVMSVGYGGNVGIGTTTPSEKLSIRGVGSIGAEIVTDGATNSRPVLGFFRGPGFWHLGMNIDVGNTDNFHFRYNGSTYPLTIQGSSGNVGIGSRNPTTKLQVNGNFQLYPSANAGTNGALKLRVIPGSSASIIEANSDFVWANHDIIINAANSASGNTNQMVVHRSGNVGIGTSSPNEKLTVNGTIYGKEVKVDLSVPGPDYVFEKDYDLPSLQELQQFIDRHKHLPEVPSAEEMKKEGIEVGAMNILLLKKIEELTLYVIQLERRVAKQEDQIKQLQNN